MRLALLHVDAYPPSIPSWARSLSLPRSLSLSLSLSALLYMPLLSVMLGYTAELLSSQHGAHTAHAIHTDQRAGSCIRTLCVCIQILSETKRSLLLLTLTGPRLTISLLWTILHTVYPKFTQPFEPERTIIPSPPFSSLLLPTAPPHRSFSSRVCRQYPQTAMGIFSPVVFAFFHSVTFVVKAVDAWCPTFRVVR